MMNGAIMKVLRYEFEEIFEVRIQKNFNFEVRIQKYSSLRLKSPKRFLDQQLRLNIYPNKQIN